MYCLTDVTVVSAPSSPGNLSSKTLVGGSSSDNNVDQGASPTAVISQSPSKEAQKPATAPTPPKLETATERKVERVMSEETDGKPELSYHTEIFRSYLQINQRRHHHITPPHTAPLAALRVQPPFQHRSQG